MAGCYYNDVSFLVGFSATSGAVLAEGDGVYIGRKGHPVGTLYSER
jgi:hypothetical protein